MFDKVLNTLLPSDPQKQSNHIRQRHTTWQLQGKVHKCVLNHWKNFEKTLK